MDKLNALLDRLLVILRAAPTYLTALALVAGILVDELGDIAGIPAVVVQTIAAVAAGLAVAITIIRRVTPVLDSARGLLPPPAADGIVKAATPGELAAWRRVELLELELARRDNA